MNNGNKTDKYNKPFFKDNFLVLSGELSEFFNTFTINYIIHTNKFLSIFLF